MTNLEIIQSCLDQIAPAQLQYDDWLKIGAAIKYEGGSADLWDSWSKTDSRYKQNDCFSRWNGLDKGHEHVTVGTVIKICRECGGTPPKTMETSNAFQEIPLDSPVSFFDNSQEKKDQQKIIRREWLEIEPLPPDSGKTCAQELTEYLNALFQPEEYVGFVANSIKSEPDQNGNSKWIPGGKGVYSDTAGELIEKLSHCTNDLGNVIGDCEEGGAWIRFNPLDGKGVSDSNVTDYRFTLLESDEIGINEQWSILKKLEIPCAAVVHSGGKSIHAIVRIDAHDYKEYQNRVDSLYDICKKNGLMIDRKNRNPSRLSRMPGVYRGGTRQRLIAVNIGKSSWAEWCDWIAAQNDDLPEVESLDAVWNNIPPLADCLIEGVLRKGHKMLVSGPSKAGKSFLLLELVVAIAEGGTWLGWKCRQGRVLYVNLELDRASCLHRILDICRTMDLNAPSVGNIDVWNLRGRSLPMDELAPKLIRRALKREYSAVVIDPIYKVITGDENSADQMAKFCNQFDKVCSELKCAVIYCHHHSKGGQAQKRAQDRSSGSGVFARDPDALIDMVELDIDQTRRQEIRYRFQVRNLQRFLNEKSPGWDNSMDYEDAEKLEILIEKARKISNDADSINGAEIRAANGMTGWKISGILREFSSFPDRFAFFRYPIHIFNSDVDVLLKDCPVVGEWTPVKKTKTSGKKQSADNSDSKKRNDALSETQMAYSALDDGNPVTTKRVADYLDISIRRALERLKAAGFQQNEKYEWERK